MPHLAGKFLSSRSGSLVPILVVALVPIVAVVGLSVDYTSAVSNKSSMQEALDAATLAIMTLPTSTSLAARQQALQDQFTANNGQGTATLGSFVIGSDGTSTAKTSASFAMPTNFMQIAKISTVQLAAASSVTKTPSLVQTTFKVTGVSGYWGKTMILWGTQFGATTAQKLMTISYTYNGYGDPKGYGTTIVNTVNGSTSTMVQKQVCTTDTLKNLQKNLPGSVIQTDAYGTTYSCTDTFYPTGGAGAVIDVSQMGQLSLEMDVPSGNPTKLYSNDATTSNRLYIGTSPTNMPEVATGQVVDIFSAVPCQQTSYQAWEDGGNAVPAPVSNADFFYTVMGKCDFNQRPSQTLLTQ